MTNVTLGLIGMAIPGLFMGEEMCAPKTAEMYEFLTGAGYTVKQASAIAMSAEDAMRLGRELAGAEIDCVVAAVTTFVGDYYAAALAEACKKPVFLWLVERELQCISLVAGPLCAATLKNLHHPFRVSADDIGPGYTADKLRAFALACKGVNCLRGMRIGFSGGHASHMFSQSFDEVKLFRQTGAQVVHIPLEEFYMAFDGADEAEAAALWQKLTGQVGAVRAAEASGLESCKYYAAAKKLVETYDLNALSLNCFPHLKARICLAVSLLNDEGVAAGCEGAVLDTLLMYLSEQLTGEAAVNADVLRMLPEKNAMVFSHCGAGAMSLAASKRSIEFGESIETNGGVSVFYDTALAGKVTLANLVYDETGMRLCALMGTRMPDESGYIGNPLQLAFEKDVREVYEALCMSGAGVHWIGLHGDWRGVLAEIAEMLKIPYTAVG